jgi:hypothetical protein
MKFKNNQREINFKVPILMLFTLASIAVHAQKTKAVLQFKDGTTKTGLGKIVGNNIKFRNNKNHKAVKYDFSILKSAKIYYQTDITTYVSVRVKERDKPIVLEQVATGKVNLYQKSTQGYNPGFANNGFGGAGFTGGYTYSINNFYVKKKGKAAAFHLGSNQLFTKNFKQAASDFFKDCPELVKKIQNRELKKKHLREIVEYYNNQCY